MDALKGWATRPQYQPTTPQNTTLEAKEKQQFFSRSDATNYVWGMNSPWHLPNPQSIPLPQFMKADSSPASTHNSSPIVSPSPSPHHVQNGGPSTNIGFSHNHKKATLNQPQQPEQMHQFDPNVEELALFEMNPANFEKLSAQSGYDVFAQQ
jgi:hypothetical protein